jgi:hypothetical protein
MKDEGITLIEQVAELRKLEYASREMRCDRQEYATKMAATAPALLDVLGTIQRGDADELQWMIDFFSGNPTRYAKNIEVLRRYQAIAAKMEASK